MNDKDALKNQEIQMTVLILSSSCCYPGMAVFDEQARKVVEQAALETGTEAEIKIVPAATALYSGVIPKNVRTMLMNKFSQHENGPAILIKGEIVSYGVPQLEAMKTVLTNLKET